MSLTGLSGLSALSGFILKPVPAPAGTLQFVVNTSKPGSASNQFVLPLTSDGVYNFTVDWGDESTDQITQWNSANTTHTYSSSGVYTIAITGTIAGFRFNLSGDRQKMVDMQEWGPLEVRHDASFYGCNLWEITATDAPTVNTTSFSNMFRNCADMVNANFSAWDVSGVTNTHGCFRNAEMWTGNGMENWDMSSVTNARLMFSECDVFNGDVTGWDVSSVIDMRSMFSFAGIFNRDISGWNTSSVTSMAFMFDFASQFEQNLGSWNVTSLTTAANMFRLITLTTANYSNLLIGWEAQAVNDGVALHGGGSKYNTAGNTARQALIDDHSWTFNDGGPA